MHNKLRRIIITVLTINILSIAAYSHGTVFAQTGGEGFGNGASYATCDGFTVGWATCGLEEYGGIHWIKMPIDMFKRIYGSNRDRNSNYDRDPINTCMDTSKNTSGWIVSAGYYGYQASREEQYMYLYNQTSNSYQMGIKKNHSTSHSVDSDGKPVGGNIFSDPEVQNVLNYLTSQGHSETDLAVFCPTMSEREVSSTATFQSQTRSKINDGSWSSWNGNASDYYVQSSNDQGISTSFYYQHQLKTDLDRSGKSSLQPWWQINRTGSVSEKVGTGNKTVNTSFSSVESLNSASVNRDIHIGTEEKVCQTITHPGKADIIDIYQGNTYVHNKSVNYTGANYSSAGNSSTSSCAEAHHPYDFTTSASANALNTILYIGESVQASGSVKNSGTHDNNNATPHTVTPSDTVSRLFQFTVNANVAADNNKLAGGTTSSDPCDFFRNKLGTGNVTCNGNLKNETGSVANGATKNLSGTVNVPDDATSLGKKICVATAISYSDSGNGYNGGLNKTWRISGASCSTVAKKPSVQVWGSVFTNGSIATATSAKSGRTYGSWAEHLVVAGKAITGFGSGASLGYAGGSYNLALPGGQASSNATSRSPLTVSNNNSNAIGTSNIIASSQLIESLKARFATPSAVSAGVEYTTSTAEFDGQIIRNSGTKIYHIDGDVTIKNDICYGSCSGSPTRLESYNLTSNQPATLPQIIIFAKNIKINDNVKRIDAWLISENTLNTCANYSFGNSLSSSNCNQTLIVNGPIFAKNLQLNRTAGANSGNGTQQSGDVRAQEITDDGSITPAEVFNLRGDAYVWSHIQAQRSNEAVTVYTRELAPRL